MEIRKLYELLGKAHAELAREGELAAFYQQQCEDMSKTVKILLDENEKLKAELKELKKHE